MSGIENDVLVVKNVNFDYTSNPPHNGIVTADGQLLIGSTTDPNISMVANTLTAGTGITITNDPGSITIASTASLTDLHTARFIVASSTSGTGANYTTISSAIAAAQSTAINSTIFIQPGTYTENFTWPAGINLVAYTADALTPNVTIIGNITCNDTGSRSMSGIRLQTNGAALLTISGSAASVVNLDNCYLNITNSTGIVFNSSSASSSISITNCMGNLGTTGIGIFTHTGPGGMTFRSSVFLNSGTSSTASTCSSGIVNGYTSQFQSPITFSGTSQGTWSFCTVDTQNQNVTALTLGGTAHAFISCSVYAGTASAISISTAASIYLCTIYSSNTNAISGAGAILYSGLNFGSTSSTINTTTQTVSGTLQGSKNTAPTSGFLGEQLRSFVSSGAAIVLTNNVAENITSLSVTAGVWDIIGIVAFNGSVTGTGYIASVNTTSATQGTAGDNRCDTSASPNAAANSTIVVPTWRQVFSSTTTVYLVATGIFSAGTLAAWGRISAVRVG